MLKTHNLCKSVKEFDILKNINLKIPKGKTIALIGPSGAGKTSLLHILGLLDTPTKGTINLFNYDVSSLNDKKRTDLRLYFLGFVYQFNRLLHNFNAIENVAIPLFIQKYSKKKAFSKSIEILKEVNLGDRLYHKVEELSGGERQRVSIARAIVHNPKLLLADEPTGNLDSDNSKHVFDLIINLAKKRSMSTLIATHNKDLANKMDEIIYIKDGQIIKKIP